MGQIAALAAQLFGGVAARWRRLAVAFVVCAFLLLLAIIQLTIAAAKALEMLIGPVLANLAVAGILILSAVIIYLVARRQPRTVEDTATDASLTELIGKGLPTELTAAAILEAALLGYSLAGKRPKKH